MCEGREGMDDCDGTRLGTFGTYPLILLYSVGEAAVLLQLTPDRAGAVL